MNLKIVMSLPLLFLSTISTAENVQDNVLPQLSYEAQQEQAKQAEYLAQQEAEKMLSATQLEQVQQRIAQEIGQNQLLLPQATAQIYSTNNFQPIWQQPAALKSFLKEYALFAVSGVSPKSAAALQQILAMPEGLGKDILLTDSFLDYLYYQQNVAKQANQWLYNLGSYKPKAPENEIIVQWLQAVTLGDSEHFVANLAPQNHIYQEMAEKLWSMSQDELLPVSNETGERSKKSKKAKNSQPKAVTFYQLALNAQRLRIIPSFNNGLFVNIPSYQLYYFRDGQLVLQSRVIVGRTDRRTPVMQSQLSNLVVNPPWNVPASIKNKDIVPKMRRDPSYADNHGYEIIDSAGRKVSPYSIEWEAYEAGKNFPYHLRQKAGDDSALGRFKFNMPSSDAIYLHDTPNRGLFSKSARALSSGCVRVAKSDELATLLLQEAGWTEQRKQNVLASKKTISVQIHSDNPVYLYYVTAWIEGGNIYTLPDIYHFDVNLSQSSLNWEQIKSLM